MPSVTDGGGPDAPALHPDAQAILDQGLPRWARSVLYVLGAALATFLAWASLARIDRVVVAHGRTVTAERPLVVQPFERGVVRSIEVEVGAAVERGQALVTLDPTLAETSERDLLHRRALLVAQVARLSAELEGVPFRGAAEGGEGAAPGPAAALLEARLAAQRRAEFGARLAAYDAALARLEARQAAARALQQALAGRLEIAREIEAMRVHLRARDAGSLLAVLQAQSERLGLEQQIAAGRSDIEDYARQVGSVRAEREAFEHGWRAEASRALIEVRRELETATQQLAAARRRSELIVLRAPADGVVLEVARRSVGSVVQEAETLVTLVPSAGALEAEVEIGSEDSGHVRAGDAVRVKLGALPFQRHGTLSGAVRVVNADVLPARPPGQSGPRGVGMAHRVRIALDGGTLRGVPAQFRLLPGMEVVAEVRVGERSVVSYFLEPILRVQDESLRER